MVQANNRTHVYREKAMATLSSILAWRIPGTAEPFGLPSIGSHWVGHNWNDLAAAAAAQPYMTTGKTIALMRWNFVGKIMSLRLNMLSRLVITFLLRSQHLLISWLQSASAVILEPRKVVSYCFPIYLPWSDGTGGHGLSFLNVEL